MHTKRIIPCLDVKDGKVVKGVNFEGLKEVGDPLVLAKKYNDQQADELVFLDISATNEGRSTMIDIVEKVAKEVFIPFTVGGGINTIDQIKKLLRAGADKVSLNSAAIKNPNLIKEGAKLFGSQCIVVAIDAKQMDDKTWHVFTHGGTKDTGIDLLTWVQQVIDLGAGELLLTSMDADGTKQGFDLAMLKAVQAISPIPIIASGGCGKLSDFGKLFDGNYADAALAASLFHYDEVTVQDVKQYLNSQKIAVRGYYV